jgi:alkyl sulfatase BDS1-like metallo-beta-lactamase superfamily hydrolase
MPSGGEKSLRNVGCRRQALSPCVRVLAEVIVRVGQYAGGVRAVQEQRQDTSPGEQRWGASVTERAVWADERAAHHALSLVDQQLPP